MTMRRWMVLGAIVAGLLGSVGAQATVVNANYKLTPAQQAWADAVAKRFAKCDIQGGALASFTPYPYMPDPQDWFALIELPSTKVGDEEFIHTLVIHTVSNSAYVFTSGGGKPTEARGPIPLSYECTILKKPLKPRGTSKAKAR